MELEPYRRALEKLVQKIDLHLEMCSDAGVQPDTGKRLTELEGKFYQLLSDVEVRRRRRVAYGIEADAEWTLATLLAVTCLQTIDPTYAPMTQQVRKRAEDIVKELAAYVALLERQTAASRGTPQASSATALLHRYEAPCDGHVRPDGR